MHLFSKAILVFIQYYFYKTRLLLTFADNCAGLTQVSLIKRDTQSYMKNIRLYLYLLLWK